MNMLSGRRQFLIIFPIILSNGAVGAESAIPKFDLSGNELIVSTQGGERQTIHLSSSHVTNKDVRFEDANFDGALDIIVDLTEGANQKNSNVYLDEKKSGMYVFSKQISALPCLFIDDNKKQVVGECFHSDACTNWLERYEFDSSGRMHLTEKKGTYCDPSSGDGFEYEEKYKSNKLFFSKTRKLPEGN